MCKILKYDSPEDVIESIKNIGEQLYVNSNDRKIFVGTLQREGKVEDFKVQLRCKDCSVIWVVMSARVVDDEAAKEPYIEGFIGDITKSKKAEEELIAAKEAAEKADKLKSNFLAQMSHEIRTPINTILNFTSLLRMDFESIANEDNKDCFNSIERGAHRLLRTINLILNISDVESGSYQVNFEKIHLINEILNPVIKEFKRSAELKNINLSLKDISNDCYFVIADKYTITQVFINLVDNAIKYTHEGSITVFAYRLNNELIVDVADTGIGISPEYIPNLFNKFSQEDQGYTRKYEGNGLGLALVKNYCKINNVDISISSKKGEGSVFSIKFFNLPQK